jgi:hypothetical protein
MLSRRLRSGIGSRLRPVADDYAREYGYYAIAIDIESSQLWDDAWGNLDTGR